MYVVCLRFLAICADCVSTGAFSRSGHLRPYIRRQLSAVPLVDVIATPAVFRGRIAWRYVQFCSLVASTQRGICGRVVWPLDSVLPSSNRLRSDVMTGCHQHLQDGSCGIADAISKTAFRAQQPLYTTYFAVLRSRILGLVPRRQGDVPSWQGAEELQARRGGFSEN